MSSATEIANMALLRIGGERITDISDLNSSEAVKVNIVYDKVRKSLLRSFNWSFALKEAALSGSSTTAPSEYSFAYALPADFVKIKKIICPTFKWARIGNSIQTNDNVLNLQYVADLTDTELFDSLFVEVLVLKMALELSYSIASDKSLKSDLQQEMVMKFREARQMSAQEKYPNTIQDTSWINSRLT